MRQFITIVIIFIFIALFFWFSARNSIAPSLPKMNEFVSPAPSASTIIKVSEVVAPISNARERITKKPFGIYISPKDSPVSPERFMGYHTGVDFETFLEEQNIDVPIFAACGGKLIYKNWVSGYGGTIVQSCVLSGKKVTVLYGHLNLSSIKSSVNSELSAGQKIGILGNGYSTQTNGERKHLHLAVHNGEAIDLYGYVQNKNELDSWIDFLKIFN